jgi:hypothetical protein
MSKKLLLQSLALLLASAPALATTWIVDASGGPGSQFTDIGAAINAASPGDVILVLPGTYPGFATSKGLAIIGQGSVIVNGQAAIVGVPSGERTALIALTTVTLVVDSCAGPVLVQDVHATSQVRTLSSDDVRCRNVTSDPASGFPTAAFTVESSRVEIVASTLQGSSDTVANHSGGDGITSFSGGRLHVVDSTVGGGNGANSPTFGVSSGGGGTGIRLAATSDLRIVGGVVSGGGGGVCVAPQCTSDCSFDGGGGYGILGMSGTTDFHSASTNVAGTIWYQGPNCLQFGPIPFGGTGHTLVTPDDPVLSTSGTPSAGQAVTFTLRGPPGAQATLWLGRGLFVNSTPPVAIEELVPRNRVFHLGPIPPTGTVSRTFLVPLGMPVGAGFAAQAEVVLPSNEIRRTNSCPIVVR